MVDKIKYHIFIRACDAIESVHKVKRPFELTKTQVIKVCFYSIYSTLQRFQARFTVIGDNLSPELMAFFVKFDDVVVDNVILGNASRSLQKQIDLALESPDDEWLYLCEDDYLHAPYAFQYITDFLENRQKYLATSSKKKNYLNQVIGDLSQKSLIIHPPDYPDRYEPPWKRLSFIFLSRYCHWRQITNTTHTILLQGRTLREFEKYIKMSAVGPSDSKLSERVYGRILFRKKALCVSPIKGLSTHMTEGVMTPLVDWYRVCQDVVLDLKKMELW